MVILQKLGNSSPAAIHRWYGIMLKTAYILFYLACAGAFVSVIAQMLAPAGRVHSGEGAAGELAGLALAYYRDIDAGAYPAVAEMTVEGRWRKGAAPREYHFAGVLQSGEVIDQLNADYGENGWMLRFVALRALGAERLPLGSGLDGSFRREIEIIKYLERLRGVPLPLALVTLQGHVSGRCNIINWERRIPLVMLDGKWRVVSRGTPEDYELVRREQLFKPVTF